MEILRRRLAVKCRFPRLPESGSTVDGKVPSSVIFLLTAPLTGTHIHPLALSVIPPACCGLLRTPPGVYYTALHSLPGFQKQGERRSTSSRGSCPQLEEENMHKTFCKCYGGKNRGANSFVYANPIGTINYLKKMLISEFLCEYLGVLRGCLFEMHIYAGNLCAAGCSLDNVQH